MARKLGIAAGQGQVEILLGKAQGGLAGTVLNGTTEIFDKFLTIALRLTEGEAHVTRRKAGTRHRANHF